MSRRDLKVDEIDQQNGIAHDDASERDHADHGGRRELRAEQGVPRHHADNGEGNGCHDDERHAIGAELRDDQQVDEHETHRIGETHVAKRLVGDSPFAVPLHAEFSGAIRRTHEALHEWLTSERCLFDL